MSQSAVEGRNGTWLGVWRRSLEHAAEEDEDAHEVSRRSSRDCVVRARPEEARRKAAAEGVVDAQRGLAREGSRDLLTSNVAPA